MHKISGKYFTGKLRYENNNMYSDLMIKFFFLWFSGLCKFSSLFAQKLATQHILNSKLQQHCLPARTASGLNHFSIYLVISYLFDTVEFRHKEKHTHTFMLGVFILPK